MTLAQPETTGVPAACTSRAPAGIHVCSTRAHIGVLEEKERGGRRQAAAGGQARRGPRPWGRLWDLRASRRRLRKGRAVLTPGRAPVWCGGHPSCPLLPCRPCRPQEHSGSCLSSLACQEHSTQSGWDCWDSDIDTLKGHGPESPTTCLRCLPHLPVHHQLCHFSAPQPLKSRSLLPFCLLPMSPCKPPGAPAPASTC